MRPNEEASKPLRIALITNIPTPYRLPFLTALDSELRSRGGNILTLFARRTEPNRKWAIDWTDARFPYEIMKGLMIEAPSAYIHFNPSVFLKVARYRPNVLFCAGSWLFPTVWIALIYAKAMGIPCVFWSEAHARGYRRSGKFVNFGRRLILSAFNAFACPNPRSFAWTAAQCYGSGTKRYIPLANTVNERIFRPTPDNGQIRVKLAIGSTKVVFITVCQLIPSKGVLNLVRNIVEMAAEGYECALIVVGDGPLRDEIDKAIIGCEAVILLGSRPQGEIAELIQAADAFVLNTKFDKNPLAPIEAAFCAKPILLGKASGNIEEIVIEDDNGFEVDDATLPRVLRHCVALGRTALAMMGLRSRQIAEERFETHKVVRTLVDSLNDLTSGHEHGELG